FLLAPLVLLPLDGLELIASVVHQAADRRARLGRHLDEVKALLVCDAKRSIQGKDAKLVVLVVDQSHLGAADLIVDPQLFKRYGTKPRSNSGLLYSSIQIKQNGQQGCRPLPGSAPCARRAGTPSSSSPGGEGRRPALQSVDGTGNPVK